jgi:hypothetical protein
MPPSLNLRKILGWTDDDHHRRVHATAMSRAMPDMLRRNARIVALNLRPEADTLFPQQP